MSAFHGNVFETRCIFCNASAFARPGECDNVRHCHFCRKAETLAGDPCIAGQTHHWVSGHDFQPVPVR